MRIIIAPAKKMRSDDTPFDCTVPCFLEEASEVLTWLRSLTKAQRKTLWGCNDKIAAENEERLAAMDLNKGLTPALFAYDGIQYQYMAPIAFESVMLDWANAHLRILSGFYGVLRPMDGVVPYRLEMQAKAAVGGAKDLYGFWGSRLYEVVLLGGRTILDLASLEYGKAIHKYLQPGDRLVSCVFGEMDKGKVVTKGVYAKMARGEMVRYLAELKAEEPEAAKGFAGLGYAFHEELSTEDRYVFLRETGKV